MQSLRQRAREIYQEAARSGHPMTLRQLSERSPELLQEDVPYTTIKTWSTDDGWAVGLRAIAWEDSQEHIQAREQLDAFRETILDPGQKDKDRASASRGYCAMLKSVPPELAWTLEDEVEDLRDALHAISKNTEALASARSTCTRSWIELGRFVMSAVQTETPLPEDGGVDADSIILS